MRVAIASKTALLLALVIVFVIAVHRTGAALQSNTKLKDPQFIADGARLFATNCGNAYCHGAGGMGGGGPRLRDKGLESSYAFKSISNGMPGTSMPSFKSEFSEDQIWKLVAFIISDAKSYELPRPSANASPTGRSSPPHPDSASSPTLAGSAQAGKVLFFDSGEPKSCQACHAFNGEGGTIGPDLLNSGSKPAKELFSAMLLARSERDPRYVVMSLVLKNGDRIIGIKKEEDAESVRVYDIAELPAVLRTVQKSDISRLEAASDWPVHKSNASLYTIKQLLDLVTFLKSSQPNSSVTLRDMIQ